MTIFSFSNTFDPVNALLRLQQDLERVFERPTDLDLGASGGGVFPPVNVLSDREGLVLRLEVPGVAPESMSVEAEGRTLRVSGKREPLAPAGAAFHRRERWTGEFSRSLQLPAEVDPAQASAQYKNGILSIRVPVREEARPRQIQVQTR